MDGGKEYLESIDFDIPETETFKQNGKTYIIPTSTVTSGLIYNKDLFNDLDKQEYTLTDYKPEMFKIMKQIKSDNSCFPGSESLDNDTLRLQFSEGNIGMFFGASWDVGVFTDQFKAKCDWGLLRIR